MFTTLISASELAAHLDDAGWIIVDSRFELATPEIGPLLYKRGHISGAVYAHLNTDLSGPPVTDHGRHPLPTPEAMIALFERLGISNSSQVVVYDIQSGAYAARLWWMLRYMGHEAAAVLDGGWPTWLAAGLPTRAGVETRSPGVFTGAPRRDRLVTLPQVAGRPLLIDGRDEARFRGEEAGPDPIAGHIPGAINHPYTRNLTADGLMLSPTVLRQQLGRLLGATPAEEATFYCGSGVIACGNILAQLHAGLPEGKVYVGSWSEWSRNGQPIASWAAASTPLTNTNRQCS